ncbi:MAG: hypothetical protein KDK36_07840 [Leptospiraceae bacterium]|nr:hypothetical protein [Leptospiraceae bacterium]
MKKLVSILLALALAFPMLAVEQIGRTLAEKAETPQEKKAVREYLSNEAKTHKNMAKKMRKMAKVRKGGKGVKQDKHKEEMLEEADALDKLAKEYQELADSIK